MGERKLDRTVKHKLRAKLKVTFTPTAGKPATHTKTVTLKLAKKKKR